jgi:hypothetical protein
MSNDQNTRKSDDEVTRLKETCETLIMAADTPEYLTLDDIAGAGYILRRCLDQDELPLNPEAIPLLRQIAGHIETGAVHLQRGNPPA